MSYHRLMVEHDAIERALAHMQVLVDAPEPDLSAAMLGLSDLAGQLARHLALEDSFIYPRMIKNGDAESARTAQNFIRDFAELRHDWGLYLGEWSCEAMACDWETFRFETVSMIVRLALRVRAENELLYTAALRSGAISLRERAAANDARDLRDVGRSA